jgi:hypothetical protein
VAVVNYGVPPASRGAMLADPARVVADKLIAGLE